MHFNYLKTKKVVDFYLSNIFSPNFFLRNFSENIFLKLSKNNSITALVLKLLICDFNNKKNSEWLVIFTKKTKFPSLKKFIKFKLVLVETIIKISVCYEDRIFRLLEETIITFVDEEEEEKSLKNFVAIIVSKILEKKLSFSKRPILTFPILSLIYSLISKCSGYLEDCVIFFLEWAIAELLLKISNLNLIYLGEYQLKCLILIQNISNDIKNRMAKKKLSFNIFVIFLTAFSNFYFSIFYPHLYEKLLWNFISKIENKFYHLARNSEKEIITLFPLLLGFFFLDTKKNFYYVNCFKISHLFSFFLSDSFERIFSKKEIEQLISLIYNNLLCSNEDSRSLLSYDLKIFSAEEKFCCAYRKSYLVQVFNFIEFYLKKNSFLSFESNVLINWFSMLNNKSLGAFNSIYLRSLINGNSVKGVFVNRFSKEMKKELQITLCSNLFSVSEKNFCYIVDLICTYRYQIPIKNIIDVFYYLLQKDLYSRKTKIHVLNYLERALCLRGNDGIGINLLDFDNYDFINYIGHIDRWVENFNLSNNIKELFSKFFLRTNSHLNYPRKKSKIIGTKFICKCLEDIITETTSYNSMCFTMELIFLITNDFYNFSTSLSRMIEKFSFEIIYKNHTENLSYVFEYISKIALDKNKNSMIKLHQTLFLGICNPHIWYNSFLVKSLLIFLESFVCKFSYLFSIEYIISILRILTLLIKKQKIFQTGCKFKVLNIIKNLPTCLNFLPHMFEILHFQYDSLYFNRRVKFIFNLVLLNLTQIDFPSLKKVINKIKINGLSFYMDSMLNKNNENILSMEILDLFEKIFERSKLPREPLLKKFFKTIIRSCINNSWELEKYILKNNTGTSDHIRQTFKEIEVIQLDKLKALFKTIFLKLTQANN